MTTAAAEAEAGVELEAGEDPRHPGEAEMRGRGLRLMRERDTTVVGRLLSLLSTEREIIIAENCRRGAPLSPGL